MYLMSIKSMTVVNGGYAFCFYEAFCGIAAKYEAHLTVHEANPDGFMFFA